MKNNVVLDGLFGLCVGDALGVPVEFQDRYKLKENPIVDMIGYGTHNQPPGTWSDDSSMTFCLAESLCNGFDLKDIGDKFCRWLYERYWTPYGNVFDVGGTTSRAIGNFSKGIDPVKAGEAHENSIGNGSLMRILPMAFYVKNMDVNEKFKKIHQVSSLTHAHPRAHITCSVYIEIALNIINGYSLSIAYDRIKEVILNYYNKDEIYKKELPHFSRILEDDISNFSEDDIESSGYAIHTLEASLWCLFNSKSYKETVLKAVNLGEDTDTTGAVAGGLAGLFYGTENIPDDWINKIARKDDIISLSNQFYKRIYG